MTSLTASLAIAADAELAPLKLALQPAIVRRA
jgi:hypothetical protein